MSNNDSQKPVPNDKGQGSTFTAFQNLSLQSNNNNFQLGESSNNGSMFTAFQNLSLQSNNNHFELGESSNNGSMFTAFQNLSLQSNNNHFELGESSNNNERGNFIESNNNNQNLTVYNNFGPISLRGSRLSPVGLKAPPSTPSLWIGRPGVSSSTNSGQPSASPQSFLNSDINLRRHNFLFRLLNLMKSSIFQTEFLSFYNTYESAERESWLLDIGRKITTNHSTFLDLALNKSGSGAIRTLIKRSPSLDALIFDAVCENFHSLMQSTFGRYLVVPTIRAVDKPRKEILYQLTYDNTIPLARTEIGCGALNDVFQEIKGRFRDDIFKLVAANAGWLSFDPYGTHVVQNFLILHNPLATREIAETLYGKFFELAVVRHGSYVVEKCLRSDFGRKKVLEEFRGDDKKWVRMANDKFGNFVAQCALKEMKKAGMKQMLREFVEKLRPHFREMMVGPGKNTLRVIEEEIENWILGFPEDLPSFLS